MGKRSFEESDCDNNNKKAKTSENEKTCEINQMPGVDTISNLNHEELHSMLGILHQLFISKYLNNK